MRLINTRNLEIDEFVSSKIPKYAILSHTWGEAEATFTQWRSRLTRSRKSKKPGFAKILATCRQARRDNIDHVWADTVCINKESSAELSEAINSMFAWYARAEVCYVYLADIPNEPPGGVDLLELMGSSRWFSRGWTLQELIAPEHVTFFTQSWENLGTKKALSSLLSDVTGIDALCLRDRKQKPLKRYSIAQRMSWAADRTTTRPEDQAYCLLGIFGIHLSPIYGEGIKAFIRLQEEVIRTSDDHSFLAFDTLLSRNSLLADHPNLFRDMRDIYPMLTLNITPKFSLKNAGLSIRTPLIRTLSPYWVFAALNCVEAQNKPKGAIRYQICLPLLGRDGIYMRAREPIQLIRRNLSGIYIPGVKTEIEDLTTHVQTKYLISHFTRVYPIFSQELDEEFYKIQLKAGFLLTFPRGMKDYQLVQAFPPNALQRTRSFFNPPARDSGQSSHGLLIFQSDTESAKFSKIGVYLAHNLSNGGSSWLCKLVQVPGSEEKLDECLKKWGEESWPSDESLEMWQHYDNVENFIVAARTKFKWRGDGQQVIMVEIVFDAGDLLQEQGLSITLRETLDADIITRKD